MQCIGTSWHNKQIRGGYFLGKGWVPICGLRWLYISHHLAKYWKKYRIQHQSKNTQLNKNTTISRNPRIADLVRYFQNYFGPSPILSENFNFFLSPSLVRSEVWKFCCGSNFSVGRENDPFFMRPRLVLKTDCSWFVQPSSGLRTAAAFGFMEILTQKSGNRF